MEDSSPSGLEGLLGERITVYAANYVYTGKLVGVNDEDIELDEAAIVYETGDHASKTWQLAEAMPHKWHVRKAAIESYGIFK